MGGGDAGGEPAAAEVVAKRRLDALHIGAIAAVAALIYLPSAGNPLRLWDHHVILLLAKAPQFAHGLFWHLVHYRIGFGGFSDDTVYFRVLSMPLVYSLARIFQDQSVLYYATHLLAHVGVAVVLYYLVVELAGDRTLAVLSALLFMVYGGHGDTVNLPVYTFMLAALSLVGVGMILFLGHLRTWNRAPLAGSVLLVTVATLFYDAFFLLALALPVLAVLVARAHRRASRAYVATAAGLLAGAVFVFALVVLSLKLAPAVGEEAPAGVGRSVGATVGVLLRDGRALQAARFGVEALAADAQVFLTGHFPGVWHRGNMPYWDLSALRQLSWRLHLALALLLGGIGWMRVSKGVWRGIGVALLAAGALVDVRTLLLAILAGPALLWGGGRLLDRRIALTAAAGLLVSFNIALGRGGGYNVVAFRHHYVTGFFVIAALAALLGLGWSRYPAWRRRGLMVALGLCVVLNGWVTVRILEGVKRDNEMVFSFDRALTAMAERHGPQSLFVLFSPSFIRGYDWRGFPAQDVAFDILHYHANPMTRHTTRAPFVVTKDGVVRPNPVHRQPEDGEFLFRFRLMGLPPGPYEVFGSSPGEPRIVLDRDGLLLRARRRADGSTVEWRFPIRQGVSLPAVMTLSRRGGVLHVTANDAVVGSIPLSAGNSFDGWESDNAGLLGRGFERVVAGHLVFDTYIRIGRPAGGEL